MENLGDISPGRMVTAVLEGGPADLLQHVRTRQISPTDEKIKILHYGGYEHFERVSEAGAREQPEYVRFRWTMRTKIAE